MGAKGAFFLTEPLPNADGWEWRRYMRDPGGCLIEVAKGRSTGHRLVQQPQLIWIVEFGS
jgi:hypothetical protein